MGDDACAVQDQENDDPVGRIGENVEIEDAVHLGALPLDHLPDLDAPDKNAIAECARERDGDNVRQIELDQNAPRRAVKALYGRSFFQIVNTFE